MSLSAENLIVLYRSGDSDSLAFAQYYAAARNLSLAQLIAVPCSSTEILASYSDFQTEIENTVQLALVNEYLPGLVMGIVVGYNVPGGFIDGSDIISTTSRLANVAQTYSKKTANPLFNRQVYKSYDDLDSLKALVVTRIDAPTLDQAKKIVDSSMAISVRNKVSGNFYFDNVALFSTITELEYQSEIADFETAYLPYLGLTIQKTQFWDEYTDVPVFRLTNDSFMWAASTSQTGLSFFEDTNAIRVFLYNADSDGAFTVRDANINKWPLFALLSGYASTAGSMSACGGDGFLRPRPFFELLSRGDTVGEALTLSLPYLDWTVSCFGDPLVKVRFPTNPIVDTPRVNNTFRLEKEMLADSIAYYIANFNYLQAIVDDILATGDMDLKTTVMFPAMKAATAAGQTSRVFLQSAVDLFRYGAPDRNVDSFLSLNDIKVSPVLSDVANVPVDSSNMYTSGYWEFVDTIQDVSSYFEKYYFELDASYNDTFSDIFLSSDSETMPSEWEYETKQDVFTSLPVDGVPSSFANRRVKFIGPINLASSTLFFIRIRQRYGASVSSYRISTKIVNT